MYATSAELFPPLFISKREFIVSSRLVPKDIKIT